MVMVYALCAAWVVGVMAFIRHEGWLLWVGEQLGIIDEETPRWLRWLYGAPAVVSDRTQPAQET